MTMPVSRSRADKLGKKLRDDVALSIDEYSEFSKLIEFYEWLSSSIAVRVAGLGYEPTARGKTTGTTVEKLRREQTTQLTRIHDMAGVRIVVDHYVDQDDAVERIVADFSSEDRRPQVIDRRENPSHGYRAMHVVVYPNNVPVEIQVRTRAQNAWAQMYESLADRWGRGIRYGDHPADHLREIRVPGMRPSKISRALFVELLQKLSDQLAEDERDIASAIENERVLRKHWSGSDLPDAPPLVESIRRSIDRDGVTPDWQWQLDHEYRVTRNFAKVIARYRSTDRRKRGRFIRKKFPARAGITIDYLEDRVKELMAHVRFINAAGGQMSAEREARTRGILKMIAEFEDVGEAGA